jgi:hypothetical protein
MSLISGNIGLMVAAAEPGRQRIHQAMCRRPREVTVMIVLLTVIAIVITGVPLTAVALVTVASRREENARSIAGRAPGPLEGAARRLLAFHATGIGHPAAAAPNPVPANPGAATPATADPTLADPDDLALAS